MLKLLRFTRSKASLYNIKERVSFAKLATN